MTAPEALVTLLAPWAEVYGDSAALSTLMVFGHLAALLFAGGLAVTLDRGTLRAVRGDESAKARQLADLAAAHRLVLRGLALSVVTGVLMFAADVETYLGSWIYGAKMALVAALLVNGFVMTRAERRIRVGSGPAAHAGWQRLRRTALASLVLWFATTLAGVALVNA